MKFRKKNNPILIFLLSAAVLYFAVPAWINQRLNGKLAIRVITAEAADQTLWCMAGVGEVIRNRGKISGFSVLKKDLEEFYRRQPPGVHRKAHAAWFISRFSNLTQDATHFENVTAFGPPPWEGDMEKTVKLDDHQFYKRK